MANRKVLINRHTSGSSAPNAAEMYKGEIAVAHETGKETLFTKNNAGDMVPFISCAQTISIIDGKIAEVDIVYDVNKKAGEPYINVETATTQGQKTFTLSTSGVASDADLDALSAGTVSKFENVANILSALTDVVVTGISGDSIIVAEKVDASTGSSNSFNLTHKQALATNGFNKLATDAYGHVTASTAVATEDIQALGFKTSAQTGEDLEALSASVVTNKTNIEALSAGTQHDIEALSGDVVEYVKVVSGNIETVINELSANTMAGDAAVFASAKTYTDEAIEALDSAISASSAGKYFTALAIENGKLVAKEEADIPVLSVESAGTGNVVASITVADHKITYQTASVATSEGIAELSAATIALSAGTVHDLDELSGATEAISGYAHDEIAQLSGATEAISGYAHNEIAQLSGATVAGFNSAFTAIQGMDKDADVVAGQVVTTVSEVDGVVSETKANVKDLQLGGYVKDTTATGDIASTDTINAALSKLENKANAITIANADGSINVTTGATGTDINVNIKSGEKVLAKDGDAGLYTDLDLVKITTGLPATVKERYQLLATDDSQIGVNIDVPKDSHIVSINYISDPADAHYQNLEYVYIDASGATQTTYVDMSSLVIEAEFKSGVTATNGIVHGVVAQDSESFLTVDGDGFKLSGVQDAIDDAIEALDVTGDTAAAGQYVAAIEQTDGLVAVKTRANVSEAVLNNYAKGSDATAVAATDTVNQAISKLENQVDAAKAAATTKVVEGTDAGNNMTITPTTGADGSVTYTVNLADIASDAALEAVSGIVDTFSAATVAEFNSAFTAINTLSGNAHDAMIARDNAVFSSAKTYTDEQIDEVYASGVSYTDAKVAAEIALLDSSTAVTAGKYITGIAIADGKISGITEESLPANVVITATTATPVNTASAVLTGVTAAGTDNHKLTFGMSNKVFSATTSESADTAAALTGNITSGQVSDIVAGIQNTKVNSASTADSATNATSATVATDAVHASAATKVDEKLTLTDGTSNVEYDGSAAQSVTFGTTTSVTGQNSMSITNGIVDVDVIDCGEY